MKGTSKALALAGTTAALLAGAMASSGPAYADDDGDAKVTICHAAGLADTTHYETLTIGRPAAYGPAGHFYENGTPRAGHEDDKLGPCKADGEDETPDPDPVDETPDPDPVDETPDPDPVDETPDPDPVDETPDPAVETPDPAVETPDPAVETPDPVDETPDPVVKTPEIVAETPDPAVETPDPAVETPVLASEAPVPTTAAAADSGTLPVTGSTNTWLALSALTLVGLGSALWALSRRSPTA